MKNPYYIIPQGRKEFIRAYLKESECSPANGGYNVLYHIISIATDHPEFNVQKMFYVCCCVSRGVRIHKRTMKRGSVCTALSRL